MFALQEGCQGWTLWSVSPPPSKRISLWTQAITHPLGCRRVSLAVAVGW